MSFNFDSSSNRCCGIRSGRINGFPWLNLMMAVSFIVRLSPRQGIFLSFPSIPVRPRYDFSAWFFFLAWVYISESIGLVGNQVDFKENKNGGLWRRSSLASGGKLPEKGVYLLLRFPATSLPSANSSTRLDLRRVIQTSPAASKGQNGFGALGKTPLPYPRPILGDQRIIIPDPVASFRNVIEE